MVTIAAVTRSLDVARRTAAMRFSAMLIVVLSLSSPANAQTSPPAFPTEGATLARENDFLAVWDVTRASEATAPLEELTMDQVSVTLTPAAVKVTGPDGEWAIEYEPLGFVRFEPRGTIRSIATVGDTPSRAVVFQIKTLPASSWPMTEGIPGQFPRAGAVKLFEVNGIRVWDQTWAAGVPIANHLHYAPTAAVFVSGGVLKTIDKNGTNPPFSRSPGEVISSTSPMAFPYEEEHVLGQPRAIWLELTPEHR